jgi:hypothetical protein
LAPAIQQSAEALQRAQLESSLTKKLTDRPVVTELVQSNIMAKGKALKRVRR